ncbi:hypothetical protein [Algoriphagus sp. PAP.12]|uniref:hypothetical protein n=1 Tax=Algoriphagus sp. PAP.12 TaxID=2996678 RepID=UPI00227C37E5|nr:hypothetical protein [Algoriphagus sp. PAP.12]
MDDLLKAFRLLMIGLASIAVLLLILVIGLFFWNQNPEIFSWESDSVELSESEELEPESGITEEGIHLESGLVADDGYQLIIANCTKCHSANLVTQNRGNRDYWKSLIIWMQTTQGLWELGDSEEKILDYLSKNYAPVQEGRRANLSGVQWYELED